MSTFNFPDYPDAFLDHPDSFYIIQIHFLDYPDTFYIIWKLSSSSWHFLDHPETFQFIRTLCILSGYFLDYPDTFYIVRKLSSSSRHFPVHLDTLHIIWILCIASGHFSNYPEILQPIINLSQKLSGFAKFFRVAMLLCHPGFSDFAVFMPYDNLSMQPGGVWSYQAAGRFNRWSSRGKEVRTKFA